jgi:Raf kinase inhibitor-like YbhB/YbcL family protein
MIKKLSFYNLLVISLIIFNPNFVIAQSQNNTTKNNVKFQLQSFNFKEGGIISNSQVFKGFGCSGENKSPQLVWKNAPMEAKSFAITVYDPDAPTGSGWWHWSLVNIPANYSQLPVNFGAQNKPELQEGMLQIKNDYGTYAFGGPCPPQGDKAHRYIFTIYALKVHKLELPNDPSSALVGFMINQNMIAKTQTIGKYSR